MDTPAEEGAGEVAAARENGLLTYPGTADAGEPVQALLHWLQGNDAGNPASLLQELQPQDYLIARPFARLLCPGKGMNTCWAMPPSSCAPMQPPDLPCLDFLPLQPGKAVFCRAWVYFDNGAPLPTDGGSFENHLGDWQDAHLNLLLSQAVGTGVEGEQSLPHWRFN